MAKVVEQLRIAREAKGYSLEDVEKRTQVQLHYLEAIERGDFAALPGSFYGRAFIRAYAEYVEVDPRPILQLYGEKEKEASNSQLGDQSLSRSKRFSSMKEEKQQEVQSNVNGRLRTLTSKWYTWVLVAAFIGLISLTVYLFGSSEKDSQPVDSAAPEKKQEDQKESSGKDPSGDPEITKSEVNFVKSDPSYPYGDIVTIQHADKVIVTLEAKGEGWFRLRNGGPEKPITKEENLTPGQEKVFEHPNWISLRLSRPDLVKITVNGTVIDTEEIKKAHTFQFKLEK